MVLPYIDMNPPQVYMCFPSWTPLPPPSPSYPSGSSQCTSPEHPVSCIETRLAIHFTYDILHVSMPFSHIIPPLPSPIESKRLFNTSVSLLLSCIQGYRYLLSKFHIYVLLLLLLLLSRFSRVWLCATTETAAHQAPPSLGFSRQEHWSGLPFWHWLKKKILKWNLTAFTV